MSTYADDPRFPGPDPYAPLTKLPAFDVSSANFSDGDRLSDEIAAPSSVSPQLSWGELPEGTKSLAVTCFDPDAPTASGFWHWAVFNIPADVSGLPQGAGSLEDAGIPGAVTLKGDSGIRGFYGPQPPSGHGPHRYLFAVHAVAVDKLDIDPEATATVLGFNLNFHSLGRAITWGWYENE